jgi:hypothetical protein
MDKNTERISVKSELERNLSGFSGQLSMERRGRSSGLAGQVYQNEAMGGTSGYGRTDSTKRNCRSRQPEATALNCL